MVTFSTIGSDRLLSATDFFRIELSAASCGFALGCLAGKRGHWALTGFAVGFLAGGGLMLLSALDSVIRTNWIRGC